MTSVSKQDLTQKQRAQTLEQEQLVGYWLKRKGITKKAIETHPHIDDVILLMKWRDAMWNILNNSEQAVWGAYWGYTYNKRKALKKKSLNKLEQITITATQKHKLKHAKLQAQRQLIKAKRQNPYEKSSAYMTAKSEDSAYSAPWE